MFYDIFMQNKTYAFTLIELTIAIFILSLVIVGISFSLVQISQNFSDTSIETDIFSDIKDFTFNTSIFQYNSWKIYTGGLLLYNDKNGAFIGSFEDNNNGYNYTFHYDEYFYSKSYLWYFYVEEKILSGILNENINVSDVFFNNGKIYNKLFIKDIFVDSYNTGAIFEINLNVLKKNVENIIGKKKEESFIPIDDFIKFNFQF